MISIVDYTVKGRCGAPLQHRAGALPVIFLSRKNAQRTLVSGLFSVAKLAAARALRRSLR